MELTAKDLVVFAIDAYLLPFERDIERAKETYPEEIGNLTGVLEKMTGNKKYSYSKIITALQDDNGAEYYIALFDIKQKYSRKQIVEAQKRKYKKANSDRFFRQIPRNKK
ncbi:hypothetical protein KY346_03725 [Candidatus Woesearchaeota archaeon]|nr:hypothetical protein [Candidatus Woesearchaeota archaeon]